MSISNISAQTCSAKTLSAAYPAIYSADAVFSDICCDSRHVRAGSLFVAIPGERVNGEDYIPHVLAAGAVGIVCRAQVAASWQAQTCVLAVDCPRAALAQYSACFYPAMPATIVAVTGTDGKTSTAEFTRQLWAACGLRAASIGTLGVRPEGLIVHEATHTTPDAVQLHQWLSALAAQGVENLVMEASSHGLDQQRLDGVRLARGAFTTFGRDHMDYHASEAEYLAAKLRLFQLLPADSLPIINLDDATLAAYAATHSHTGFGQHAMAQFRLLQATPVPTGIDVALQLPDGLQWQGILPLFGAFQVYNVLTALALCWQPALASTLVEALPHLQPIPGRLEQVDAQPIFIDYAHTPGALAKALQALRAHTSGRLRVVFGCGGARDAGKRPLMGQIAADLADVTIITDDNPRTEDAAAIRAAIAAAHPAAQVIASRAEAIHTALNAMQHGDVLLIAGKGHENYQIIGDVKHHFSDAETVREYLAAHGTANSLFYTNAGADL